MLTDRQIKALKPREREYTVSDNTKQRGQGRLVLRIRPNGTKEWLYRYHLDGRKRRAALGVYPGVSLVEARQQAQTLGVVLGEGDDPSAYLRQQRDEKAVNRSAGTLGDLLEAYCDDMEASGKRTHEQVRRRLRYFVRDPFKSRWDKPARDITSGDIRDILAHHIDRGVTTTTNRVRSYLHAAYQFGLTSEHDPRRRRTASFGLTGNPVTNVPRQGDYERQGQTVMTADDVRAGWYGLAEMRSRSNLSVLAVRLCLATAGQRISALLRLEPSHVDLERMLIDMPGSITKTEVPHVVPLTTQAAVVLAELLGQAERKGGRYLFPNHRDPERTMREDSVASLVIDYRAEHSGGHWTVRDIRRTAKTVLGELGVSKDTRDRLHGHALHDVSSKNYDRYNYWKEKQEGMKVWEEWLRGVLD